ncbi:hypothetical protein LUZ60_004881 [Juncus effusus]|nr:hypothetical protein LUZ60_004881 [Juncus effusus]
MASLRVFFITFTFLALSSVAVAKEKRPSFTVQGRVFCDTCRAGFETPVSEYIYGAKVRLECKHFSTGKVEHAVDGYTGQNGSYAIELKDNHEEEICQVVLVQSPSAFCSEIPAGRDRAEVLLADGGLSSDVRYANSLGFLKDEPLPVCPEILKQYNSVGRR